MSNDEMIAVLQADKEGKTIEWSTKGLGEPRWTADVNRWNFSSFDYRVKPEPPKPREFWIILPLKESRCGEAWAFDPPGGGIHVREVLEVPSVEPQPSESSSASL